MKSSIIFLSLIASLFLQTMYADRVSKEDVIKMCLLDSAERFKRKKFDIELAYERCLREENNPSDCRVRRDTHMKYFANDYNALRQEAHEILN